MEIGGIERARDFLNMHRLRIPWFVFRFGGVIVLISILLFFDGMPVGAQSTTPYPYISPRPGAQFVSAGTTIAIRNGESLTRGGLPDDLFLMEGAQSGIHEGTIVLAEDDKTVIFQPDEPFMPSESVSVTVASGVETESGQTLAGTFFQFVVSPNAWPPTPPTAVDQQAIIAPMGTGTATMPPLKLEKPAPIYLTVPEDLPQIAVTVPATDTQDGFIFVSNFYGPDPLGPTLSYFPYLLILEDSGEPVFYKQLEFRLPAFDFKKQPNGQLTYFNTATFRFEAMDATYQMVDFYQAGNGYYADLHDLQILPNGHILLMADDPQIVDMSEIVPYGSPVARVVGTVIQELDPNRNVVFQWRSWDYIPVTDSNQSLTMQIIRYVHGNAVELDTDGNILLSSRHLDEITKINRETGDIMWRMGGKQNQFTFIGDGELFRYQHDVRRLPNGNLSLFDNRAYQSPPYSRAVEYALDETSRTATLAWEYRNSPDTYSVGAGNAQRLPNGNTVIGWGSSKPTFTEITSSGNKILQLTFTEPGFVSYRAFRFPWEGRPAWPPLLVMQTTEAGVQLAFSWNGATDVVGYEVYAGLAPHTPVLVAEVEKTGFETRLDLTNLPDDYCYFRVLPVDREGRATFFSNLVRLDGPACHSLYVPLMRNWS